MEYGVGLKSGGQYSEHCEFRMRIKKANQAYFID